MHVISKKSLEHFWQKHPAARLPHLAWYRLVSISHFHNLNEIKLTFNSADYVPPYTVFNVAGNNFRVITVIHYNRKKLYIREVFTHAEYDHWNKSYQRKK